MRGSLEGVGLKSRKVSKAERQKARKAERLARQKGRTLAITPGKVER